MKGQDPTDSKLPPETSNLSPITPYRSTKTFRRPNASGTYPTNLGRCTYVVGTYPTDSVTKLGNDIMR